MSTSVLNPLVTVKCSWSCPTVPEAFSVEAAAPKITLRTCSVFKVHAEGPGKRHTRSSYCRDPGFGEGSLFCAVFKVSPRSKKSSSSNTRRKKKETPRRYCRLPPQLLRRLRQDDEELISCNGGSPSKRITQTQTGNHTWPLVTTT